MSPHTHVLYKSSAVREAWGNGQRRMVATRQVKAGELLAVEHPVFASRDDLAKWLARDSDAYDALYPRGPDAPANFRQSCVAKVHANGRDNTSFEGVKGHQCGVLLNSINHNCSPNAGVGSYGYAYYTDIQFAFTVDALISLRSIAPEEEVTNQYSPITGHEARLLPDIMAHADIRCDCGRTLAQREETQAQATSGIQAERLRAVHKVVKGMVSQYLRSDTAAQVFAAQLALVSPKYDTRKLKSLLEDIRMRVQAFSVD